MVIHGARRSALLSANAASALLFAAPSAPAQSTGGSCFRGRLWLGGGSSVELVPSVVLFTNDERYPDVFPGAGAVASLNVMDYGALTLQADVLRLSPAAEDSGIESSVHAGVRAGSWAGMVGAVGMAAAVVIAVATAF